MHKQKDAKSCENDVDGSSGIKLSELSPCLKASCIMIRSHVKDFCVYCNQASNFAIVSKISLDLEKGKLTLGWILNPCISAQTRRRLLAYVPEKFTNDESTELAIARLRP